MAHREIVSVIFQYERKIEVGNLVVLQMVSFSGGERYGFSPRILPSVRVVNLILGIIREEELTGGKTYFSMGDVNVVFTALTPEAEELVKRCIDEMPDTPRAIRFHTDSMYGVVGRPENL